MDILKNIPAFKFSLVLIGGILAGSQYFFNPLILISLITLTLLFAFIFFRNINHANIAILFTSFLIMLFGVYTANIDFFYMPVNSIKSIQDTKNNFNIRITGIIKELPDYDSSRIRFVLESRSIISGNDTLEISGDVMTEIRNNIFSKVYINQPVLNAGDYISLKGMLSQASGKRNPGEFDYRKYLMIHDIDRMFYASGYDKVSVISKNNLNTFFQDILFPSKIFVLKIISENYSGDASAYLKGLITGERSDISEEMKDDFINAGVMHLIAVSGLNVAYIILSVMLLLSLLRVSLVPKVFITITFLIFYCFFTGCTASIVRASIMGVLVLISILIERRIIFYNIIGISAMLILIYDAKQLFDAGFILSYTATISMVVFFEKFEKTILFKIREMNAKGRKATLIVSALFFTSLSAQIGTIPITANYFGKISIISLLANIIAVPLANLSLAIGFLQIMLATFSDYLSSLVSEINNILLSFQLLFISWCASFNFAFFQVEDFNFADMICYYLILLIFLTVKFKKDILFRVILCIFILTGMFIYNIDFKKKLQIIFFDVGQGDCALIRTPDNKIILVDCGKVSFNSNSGERTILPYLQRNGINKIDLLIITHLHLDHIGGLNYLLKNIQIGKIISSGQKYPTPFTNSMDSLVISKNISVETIRYGDYIDDIEDMRLYFLFPDFKFVNESGNTLDNNLNNGSVAFILKYKKAEVFFSGDIEKEGERFLCDTYSDFLQTDVLKVAHHGSITSSTIPFIIKNKPKYAVISCGTNNKFNHPSDIILNRLEKSGTVILRTDLEGAAIFESDGQTFNFIDWK